MLEILVIRKPLDNHIKFEWKQVFKEKLWKCMLTSRQFLQFPPNGFDICTMLNLMSNSLSSWKFMKLHENLVEIHLIWWPQLGFVPQVIELGVKLSFLLKIYAITWKDGWNMSYLVSTKCVLAPPHILN
jgi:hypothetical protein